MNKHSRPGERNDHQALTHQTTLPPGRETNGKPAPGPRAIPRNLPQARLHALAERPEPETSTPGTSKRPRVAQEGKRIEANRHQGKRPEERMGLLDSTIQNPPPPERRQDTLKKNCKRKPPGGENLCRIPTKNQGATTTPKEKVREKMGGKPPSCRTSHPKGKQAAKWKPRRKNAQRRTATQPTKSQTTFKHPRSRSPRGDQAGAGRTEQEAS